MQHQSTKQALAEDIKREILMDLQRSNTRKAYDPSYSAPVQTDRNLIESIKREILMELEIPQQQLQAANTPFVEAVKRDVLALIRAEMRMSPANAYGTHYEGAYGNNYGNQNRINNAGSSGNTQQKDRAFIEAVKRDVLAQIEAQQEAQEEMYAQQQMLPMYNTQIDPALIQAVKNSVLSELQMPTTH